MFRTEKMSKIRIICLQEDMENAIKALHNLGMIELRRSKLQLREDQQSDYSNKLNEFLIKVDGAVSILNSSIASDKKYKNAKLKNIKKAQTQNQKHLSFEELSKKINSDAKLSEVYELNTLRKTIEDELKLAKYAKSVAEKLTNIDINFSKLSSDLLHIKAFEFKNKDVKSILKKLSAIKNIEVIHAKNKSDTVLILAYPKELSLDEIVKSYDYTELDLSSKYLTGKPSQVISSMKKLIEKLESQNNSLMEKTKSLYESSIVRFLSYSEMLGIELSRSNASLVFKKTDYTSIIEGWIPTKKQKIITTTLEKSLNKKVFIENIEDKEELAPTLINHPKFLRSFDYMLEFFSLPKSDEIDPSWIFILSFPIFYGFMISDVGYGIMSLILATFIKRKTDPNGLMYNTATLWQINAFSAMFFGFLSNQYLGMPFNQFFTGFQGLNWFTDISYIAVISIVFGLIQILLGLVFGFINEYRHHKRKLAAAKLTSFILVLSGTFAIAGGLFGALSYNLTILSTIVAILSLILTLVLSGERALEVIDLISHTLSYMRIMGFGLASVIIAFLIDFAFTPKLSDGPLLFIFYLVIFLLLHVLNMIVSIFEGLVQGLRLNFVEFFTKFYEGGGVKFKPFSYKRVYTKE
ncbi:MAG: V-type ATP synthase subunit I [Candidatus Micrarchaeia archaeon]